MTPPTASGISKNNNYNKKHHPTLTTHLVRLLVWFRQSSDLTPSALALFLDCRCYPICLPKKKTEKQGGIHLQDPSGVDLVSYRQFNFSKSLIVLQMNRDLHFVSIYKTNSSRGKKVERIITERGSRQ